MEINTIKLYNYIFMEYQKTKWKKHFSDYENTNHGIVTNFLEEYLINLKMEKNTRYSEILTRKILKYIMIN